MRACLLKLLLAMPASLAPVVAHADAWARVELRDFGYTLRDLDPDDGIAPAVRFHAGRLFSDAGASLLQIDAYRPGGPVPAQERRGETVILPGIAFPGLNRDFALSSSTASVRLAGDAAAGSFGAVLASRAAADKSDGLHLAQGSTSAHPFYGSLPGAVELTPFTELVWTGSVRLEIKTGPYGPGRRGELAWARLRMQLGARADPGTGLQQLSVDSRDLGRGQFSQDAELHLSFANVGADPAWRRLDIAMDTHSLTSANSVPEPGRWALLGCGLAVAGAAAARRRARSGLAT